MMSKIYITSNATVVWLGLDEGYGEGVLKAMVDISNSHKTSNLN